jgi:hypothetical protein
MRRSFVRTIVMLASMLLPAVAFAGPFAGDVLKVVEI